MAALAMVEAIEGASAERQFKSFQTGMGETLHMETMFPWMLSPKVR